MIDAESVLIVALDAEGWRTVAAVKGAAREVPAGALPPSAGVPASSGWVVAQDRLTRGWAVLGPLSAQHVPWLRRIAATRTPSSVTARSGPT